MFTFLKQAHVRGNIILLPSGNIGHESCSLFTVAETVKFVIFPQLANIAEYMYISCKYCYFHSNIHASCLNKCVCVHVGVCAIYYFFAIDPVTNVLSAKPCT